MGFNDLSTSETIYPDDSNASESFKLVRLARTLRTQWISNPRAEINIYGYINTEAANSSVRENNERAAMRQRFNRVRSTLNQIGVPNDKVWVGGIAFSPIRGGQIDIYIRGGNINLILPFYPPYVPPSSPKESSKESSAAKEQWLDSDAAINVDPVKQEIVTEVSVSFSEKSGIRKILPPISMKLSIKPDGSLGEVGAELTLLQQDLAKKVLWGAANDVKIEVLAVGSIEFASSATERIKGELNAKLKSALSADLIIPKTSVEVSIGIGVDGKPEIGVQFTLFKW
jgi:hypothetical protein